MTKKRIVFAAVAALALAATASAAIVHGTTSGSQLDAARAATAQFRDVEAAKDAQYGELRDAQNIACIDLQGEGGMGVHYVNGGLVGDAAVNAATPEALVYEPEPSGRLRLVAAEYIVFQAAWDATHSSPPSLFGQQFELIESPNRYGLPPFYELHAWLWKHNPSGMFNDWNPRVSCPSE
jgi:hypothetical protein